MAISAAMITLSYLYFSIKIVGLLGYNNISIDLIRGISSLTKKDILRKGDPNLIKAYHYYRYRGMMLTIGYITIILSLIAFIAISIHLKNTIKQSFEVLG